MESAALEDVGGDDWSSLLMREVDVEMERAKTLRECFTLSDLESSDDGDDDDERDGNDSIDNNRNGKRSASLTSTGYRLTGATQSLLSSQQMTERWKVVNAAALQGLNDATPLASASTAASTAAAASSEAQASSAPPASTSSSFSSSSTPTPVASASSALLAQMLYERSMNITSVTSITSALQSLTDGKSAAAAVSTSTSTALPTSSSSSSTFTSSAFSSSPLSSPAANNDNAQRRGLGHEELVAFYTARMQEAREREEDMKHLPMELRMEIGALSKAKLAKQQVHFLE